VSVVQCSPISCSLTNVLNFHRDYFIHGTCSKRDPDVTMNLAPRKLKEFTHEVSVVEISLNSNKFDKYVNFSILLKLRPGYQLSITGHYL
jgi:hypothetical protein